MFFEQFWRIELLPIFLITSMIHTVASFLGHVLCLFAFCWCPDAAIDALPTLLLSVSLVLLRLFHVFFFTSSFSFLMIAGCDSI